MDTSIHDSVVLLHQEALKPDMLKPVEPVALPGSRGHRSMSVPPGTQDTSVQPRLFNQLQGGKANTQDALQWGEKILAQFINQLKFGPFTDPVSSRLEQTKQTQLVPSLECMGPFISVWCGVESCDD
jgi:hypothetical protein